MAFHKIFALVLLLGSVYAQDPDLDTDVDGIPLQALNDPELEFSCPDGFVLIRPDDEDAPQKDKTAPQCYRFFTEAVTFDEAKEQCDGLGASVAQPKNKYVANGIAKYVSENKLGDDVDMDYTKYWIGVTDEAEEGVFRWIDTDTKIDTDADSSLLNLEEEEMPNKPDDADCMNILVWRVGKSNVKWHENVCNEKGLALCQTKADIGNLAEVLASLGGPEEEDDDLDVDNMVDELEDQAATDGDNTQDGPMTISAEYIEELINALPNEISGDAGEEAGETSDETPGGSGKSQTTRSSICKLTCLERSLKAVCDIETFSEGDDTILVLNDEECRPTRNGTHLIVETGLDKCGTRLEHTKRGKVSFKNAIRVKNTGAEIVRSDAQAEARTELMILECTYDQAHTTWLSLKASNNEDIHTQHAVGSSETAEALLFLYPDIKYETPFSPKDYPIDYGLGDNIYAEIRPNVISDQIQVHILKCKATPTDNQEDGARTHWLIENSCPSDNTFQRIHSDNSSVARFTFEAFRFAGSFSEVYIWCTVMVCEAGIDSMEKCPYQCLEGDDEAQERKKKATKRDLNLQDVVSREIRFTNPLSDEDAMNDQMPNAEPNGLQAESGQSQGGSQVDNSEKNDDNGSAMAGISCLMLLISGFLSMVLM